MCVGVCVIMLVQQKRKGLTISKLQFVLVYIDPKDNLSKMLGFTKFERLVEFVTDSGIDSYEVFNKIA